ncbi:MAG: hypothetical protein KUG81_09360 [Gammaproteobacteria bacterium]|nr:hypothetical protein [Gammaproteobacteria bacterium]
MSVLESYFRAMIRGLINIDPYTKKKVEKESLSFGAALHHSHEMLPEALLEDISFSGSGNIKSVMKEILGLKGSHPNDVKKVLEVFQKVCELRHCCVHRFGKLGTKNAIKLGLDKHSALLEEQFTPTKQDLEEIADVLRTFVKTMNNYIFESALRRTAHTDNYKDVQKLMNWTWDLRSDKRLFKNYYELFASKDSPPSPDLTEVYNSFRYYVQNKQ